ncbi:MAG: hypothetical protein COV52_04775 [Gammaproteobacteria bacterium CG11_big_fil_rev_8_21_14_0_20_46_22]|nr:MAG: hypothetical protein COW05_02860 [Gammaproteobacteria bacterium CG12_big_fil_rev_8_21_14_0_65_46_12]PIR11255.1 MAG: hypothetical protein COV52_04775 [Gammaproteobacteria bacterium CG11_big_fil_rev_8_21_14_0_20_46_22]
MKVLLVIDYIKGIAEAPGTCADYLCSHPETLSNTNRLIHAFREKGFPVFFVRLAFDEAYTGLPLYAPNREALKGGGLFQLGAVSTEFIEGLGYCEGDAVFDKKSGDPFCGSGLLEALRKLDVNEAVLCGIATDNAIEHGANTAMQNNLKVVVVSDACGAATEANHAQALARIERQSASIINVSNLLVQFSD